LLSVRSAIDITYFTLSVKTFFDIQKLKFKASKISYSKKNLNSYSIAARTSLTEIALENIEQNQTASLKVLGKIKETCLQSYQLRRTPC